MPELLDKIKRVLKKPPRYILQRMFFELSVQSDRHRAPKRSKKLTAIALAKRSGYPSVDNWWEALSQRPYMAQTRMSSDDLEKLCPNEYTRILASAEYAIAHTVDLLGSGTVELGVDIDWHRDYKTAYRWQPEYYHDIEYSNLDRPSDVKFPWELSRMQWMIPLGQAYVLTGNERYAVAARDLILDWIRNNPYAGSVNWSCTMEVALRIVSWSWFFHTFKQSKAWSEINFRSSFLQSLYLHGDFTTRNLEKSDINGNHYTADAAGLVFAGLFFGHGKEPERWLQLGWGILCDEAPLQILPDGVDFEASIPYHRLVLELFLFPALYRLRNGLEVPDSYRDRLVKMARFTAAYSRKDGSTPLWGDADDGRVLPCGSQPINDHRYLIGLVGALFKVKDLLETFSGSRSEVIWLLGPEVTSGLPYREKLNKTQTSVSFPRGGFFVLRNTKDHVFVDCGPLGLGGRGGHGHNDLLSLEAVLDDVHLISDCGAYLYTADFLDRNRFRSTAYHNTPQIDGQEINRFINPNNLWSFHNDAIHDVRKLIFGTDIDSLVVSHSGYQRLKSPVTPVRTIELHHNDHRLIIQDNFEGEGDHEVKIPLHLAINLQVKIQAPGLVLLISGSRKYTLTWDKFEHWELSVDLGRISTSYGVACNSSVLIWQRRGGLVPLHVVIQPLTDS